MKLKDYFIIGFSVGTLYLHSIGFSNEDLDEKDLNMRDDIRQIEWSDWEDISIPVHDDRSGEVSIAKGKRTRVLYENAGWQALITAFVSPKYGKLWVGPEAEFYIERDRRGGVIAGSLGRRGELIWSESLVSDSEASLENLERYFEEFREKINWRDLWLPTVLGGSVTFINDLGRLFSPEALGLNLPSIVHPATIKEVEIYASSMLRLVIVRPRAEFVGEVEIFIGDENPQVLKGLENMPRILFPR